MKKLSSVYYLSVTLRTLIHIRNLTCVNGYATRKELDELIRVEGSYLGRVVSQLKKDNMIITFPFPNNLRRHKIVLSDYGKAHLESVLP